MTDDEIVTFLDGMACGLTIANIVIGIFTVISMLR